MKVVGKPTRKGKHGEMYVDGDGKQYKCSNYMRGDSEVNTWYEVDESGVRKLGNSSRPPHIASRKWTKMTDDDRLAEYVKYHDMRAELLGAPTSSGTIAAATSGTLNDGDAIKFSKREGIGLLHWLRWGSWPVQSRRAVKGEGSCLGVTYNGESVSYTHLTLPTNA